MESILLSIISLLDDAECASPANVDAGVMLRKDIQGFKKRVRADVEKSREDIPQGFTMPTHESTTAKGPEKMVVDDREFWVDSDEEDEFGGSDTDAEMAEDGDDGLPDDEDQEEGDDEDQEEEDGEEEI